MGVWNPHNLLALESGAPQWWVLWNPHNLLVAGKVECFCWCWFFGNTKSSHTERKRDFWKHHNPLAVESGATKWWGFWKRRFFFLSKSSAVSGRLISENKNNITHPAEGNKLWDTKNTQTYKHIHHSASRSSTQWTESCYKPCVSISRGRLSSSKIRKQCGDHSKFKKIPTLAHAQ